MKKKEFIESYEQPALAEAVIRQFGGWDSFKESAVDVVNHGIDGGFNGFIYHYETVKFAKDNLKTILAVAEDMADSIGVSGALELIAGFRCLNGKYPGNGLSQSQIAEAIYSESEDSTLVLNALAWFAGEEVARRYDDMR